MKAVRNAAVEPVIAVEGVPETITLTLTKEEALRLYIMANFAGHTGEALAKSGPLVKRFGPAVSQAGNELYAQLSYLGFSTSQY